MVIPVNVGVSDPVYSVASVQPSGWGGLLFDILGNVSRRVTAPNQPVLVQRQPSFMEQYGPLLLVGGLAFLVLSSSGKRRR